MGGDVRRRGKPLRSPDRFLSHLCKGGVGLIVTVYTYVTIIERKPRLTDLRVLVVNEDLGL
jgi:hypothetical protein